MPRAAVASLVSVAALSLALAGCQPPAQRPPAAGDEFDSATAASPANSSEAERTRQMEEQAADLRRRGEEVQQMEGTPEEKERAMNELLEQQQELQRQGESGAPPQ